MSYLGYPRLNFAGKFQADISTVNNVLRYWDITKFEPRFARDANFANNVLVDENGLFNPRGTGAFRLVDVRVTSGLHPDGRLVTRASDDPIIGGRIEDDNLRPNAKMVDLDQRNQTVPGLYGLRVRVLDENDDELLRGDYLPSWAEDLWRRGPGNQTPGGVNASAGYQSVLTDLAWSDKVDSPVLRALQESTQEGMLSIRFVLDGYEIDIATYNKEHTFGRLVGCIGPYASGEPKRFVAGRRLRKASAPPTMWDTPCRVDEASRTVFVDLSNSWPTASKRGPLQDFGVLRLATIADDGKPEIIGPLEGPDPDFYVRDAGIATVRLDAAQAELAATRRLALVDSAAEPKVLLAENADASWVHTDDFVFRLYPEAPHDDAEITFVATRFGRPASDMSIALTGIPASPVIELPAKITTDSSGRATITLKAKEPPTKSFIDGVTATVAYGSPARPNEADGRLSVLVFNRHAAPDRPTWNRDVHPIFQQYANLYPVMARIFDLGNYNDVVKQKTYIRRTLLASHDSPNHMPVSRDLSLGKRDMIVKWLDTKPTPPVLEITSPDELMAVLQQALLVELATLPPYCAAMFSIKPGRNVKIRGLLRGVLLEEMQHMAQVCNIINALGGEPKIGRPALVPTYPGRLPGPVLCDVQVRLRRLSIEHVKDVFMAIEKPEYPTVDGRPFKGAVIGPKSVSVDRAGRIRSTEDGAMAKLESFFNEAEYQPQTIGWFYNQIARAIGRFDRNGSLFTGDPARQVSWPDAPGILYRVTDKKSALLAIYQIIEQGEGSPHDRNQNSVADPSELGHYYRFEEIVKGRQLVRKDGKWAYEGDEIPFDPDGVYPVIDDADSYRLPGDSVGRRESLLCDESYTNMLTALNRVFNGHPDELDNSVGLMAQLQVQARRLYEIPSSPGAATVLGPAFQSPAPR